MLISKHKGKISKCVVIVIAINMVNTIPRRNFSIGKIPYVTVEICLDEFAVNPNPSAIVISIALTFAIRVAMKSEALVYDSFSCHIFPSEYRVITSPAFS